MRKLMTAFACVVLACALLMLASCSDDDDPRINPLVDNGNGTVTDTLTGLIWLKDAGCLPVADFEGAKALVATLGDGAHPECNLTDGSLPGDWRLPALKCPSIAHEQSGLPVVGFGCSFGEAIAEFALIFAPGCVPFQIVNADGTGCWGEGDPFVGVGAKSIFYWSATEITECLPPILPDACDPGLVWVPTVTLGTVNAYDDSLARASWPVRDL